MKNSLESIIKNELENNLIFEKIFNKFEIPKFEGLEQQLDLIYKSNEYMGFYKKEIYFDLIPKNKILGSMGTLVLTFVSSVKQFDIKKAMHLVPTDEIHNISITFMLHNDGNNWDTERYNYTLWKDAG